MILTHIYLFMIALSFGCTMITFFLLPFEETGILGKLPGRINNFLSWFIPLCLFLAMVAYWLS